jgi:hypothetical protein
VRIVTECGSGFVEHDDVGAGFVERVHLGLQLGVVQVVGDAAGLAVHLARAW